MSPVVFRGDIVGVTLGPKGIVAIWVVYKELRETFHLNAIDPVESIDLLDDLVVLLPGEIVVGAQGVDS